MSHARCPPWARYAAQRQATYARPHAPPTMDHIARFWRRWGQLMRMMAQILDPPRMTPSCGPGGLCWPAAATSVPLCRDSLALCGPAAPVCRGCAAPLGCALATTATAKPDHCRPTGGQANPAPRSARDHTRVLVRGGSLSRYGRLLPAHVPAFCHCSVRPAVACLAPHFVFEVFVTVLSYALSVSYICEQSHLCSV